MNGNLHNRGPIMTCLYSAHDVNIYLAPTTAIEYTMIGYHGIGNITFTLADSGGTITA
jgi:hypothetical protein